MSQAGIISEIDPTYEMLDQKATLYVDKNGSDTNSGLNIDEPKLTIQSAVDIASVNSTILINPGTYTETVTFTANGQVLVGVGRPNNVIITQADANVLDFNTRTNCQIKNMQISVTAATTNIDTINGSTGSLTSRDCIVSMTTTASIVAAGQPSCVNVSSTGTYSMRAGRFRYSNTGNSGASGNKAAFKVGDGGLIDLKKACCSTVTTSGTSLISSIATDTGSGIISIANSDVSLVCGGTLVAGLAYLGGTGITHHFGYNEIEIDATGATSAYGFFSADTATTTYLFFNHIHIENAASNYSYLVGAGSTVNSHFNDIRASDGNINSGTLNEVDSIEDGEFKVGNMKFSGNTITNTDTNGYTLVDNGQIQPLSGAYDREELLKYLLPIHYKNQNVGFGVNTYAHGVTSLENAYDGGAYSPTQNRIYFAGYGQSDEANWHYVNCDTGEIVAYAHGLSVGNFAYSGAVYSPIDNRIYFVPYRQCIRTDWHYINCNTGELVAYTHGATAVEYGYSGGVYSPTQNRIYLVPSSQSDETNWHYIDCDDGSVVAYAHDSSVTLNGAYNNGVYSPINNRIYFCPSLQSSQSTWHYVDCDDGSIVGYTRTPIMSQYSYRGGVYSPAQNRIYLVPYGIASGATWHYIDCSLGTVVSYTNGVTAVSNAYKKGVYSPTDNRIYFAPYGQADETNWHYVDCSDGSIGVYINNATTVDNGYSGGVYSPTENRIYFAPYGQADETNWHRIQVYASSEISPQVMSCASFNRS